MGQVQEESSDAFPSTAPAPAVGGQGDQQGQQPKQAGTEPGKPEEKSLTRAQLRRRDHLEIRREREKRLQEMTREASDPSGLNPAMAADIASAAEVSWLRPSGARPTVPLVPTISSPMMHGASPMMTPPMKRLKLSQDASPLGQGYGVGDEGADAGEDEDDYSDYVMYCLKNNIPAFPGMGIGTGVPEAGQLMGMPGDPSQQQQLGQALAQVGQAPLLVPGGTVAAVSVPGGVGQAFGSQPGTNIGVYTGLAGGSWPQTGQIQQVMPQMMIGQQLAQPMTPWLLPGTGTSSKSFSGTPYGAAGSLPAAPSPSGAAESNRKPYICRKCGQLKKGHVCPGDLREAASAPATAADAAWEQSAGTLLVKTQAPPGFRTWTPPPVPMDGAAAGSLWGLVGRLGSSAAEWVPTGDASSVPPLRDIPRNAKSLLTSSMLDGVPVRYTDNSGKTLLRGLARTMGVECGCKNCRGKLVALSEFERHAGSEARHPADYIFLDYPPSLVPPSKVSLKDLVEAASRAGDKQKAAAAVAAFIPWRLRQRADSGSADGAIALTGIAGLAGVGASEAVPSDHGPGDAEAGAATGAEGEGAPAALDGVLQWKAAAGTGGECGVAANVMVKVPALRDIPTNAKSLLSSGLLENVPLKYMDATGKLLLTGVARGGAIECHCRQCKGQMLVNASDFEKHAGSNARHPGDYIFISNGSIQPSPNAKELSLRDIVALGQSAEDPESAGTTMAAAILRVLEEGRLAAKAGTPTANPAAAAAPASGSSEAVQEAGAPLLQPGPVPASTSGTPVVGVSVPAAAEQGDASAADGGSSQGGTAGGGTPGAAGAGATAAGDACVKCREEGLLLRCDMPGCARLFHRECAGLSAVPDGDWHCPDCSRSKDELAGDEPAPPAHGATEGEIATREAVESSSEQTATQLEALT